VAPDDFVSPPPGVPDDPEADWPQPYAPPLTPNLGDLGYYDPSWGQLYGYDPTDWYNYDLSGYNQYGFDFVGFDRWGYDRWGLMTGGAMTAGATNWAGCNWAGYDRNGWDRDGRNEWGQRRGHPGDPRNQDWYNHHHPYEQYYQWKFQNDDPVYHRTQWDQAHGFNPNLYQNWNMSRDWHDPRNRDWAPPATTESVTGANIRASSPVVNLNASLTQFISTDKATSNSGSLMKDLADKSARDFTNELSPRTTISIGSPPPSTLGVRPATPSANHQTSFAPPALTAPAPATPPSKVSPGFTAPKLSPVPAYTPPKVAQPQRKPQPTPANNAPGRDPNPSSGPMTIPPKTGSPNPAVAPPAEAGTREPTQPCGGSSPRAFRAPRPIPVRRRRESEPPSPPSDTDTARASAAAERTGTTRARRSGSQDPGSCSRGPGPNRRPSAKHLLRGRPTWLRSGPSDRHRPCTRRRVLPRDLLLRHVRHPHQGHPSVQFRCVDGFSTPTSIGLRLVGQRSRSQSDRCPAGVVCF